jgi:hypothetical protein
MLGGEDSSERRVHVVVLTRAAEFHLLGRACEGVRGRGTGEWIVDHAAVGAELRGSRPLDGGELWPGALRAGAALVLECRTDARAFVSDEVLAIEHPGRDESHRIIAAARDARGSGGVVRAGGGRLVSLTALAGIWDWLSPRSR